MDKGNLAVDPRGLIFEAYRIDGITSAECRSIFLDWALGVPAQVDMRAALNELRAEYIHANRDHPMNAVIAEGLDKTAPSPRRRGGRGGRT
ncbi:MAG: hypothetical protein GXP05_05440 [Alphaproteobacteria bacterium]|nr:hypothetical protein [Alphaproteobacteria bacterium]